MAGSVTMRRSFLLVVLMVSTLCASVTAALALADSSRDQIVTPQVGCGETDCWPTYSEGDRDKDVTTIQYLLRRRGYADFRPNDGYFGSQTKNAVKRFQRAKGLAMNGRVGPNTWEKLIVDLHSGMDKNDAVRGLQVQLRDVYGYNLKVSGDFGSKTRSAVKGFQRKHDLRVTGRVNADTWQALISTR